MYNVATFLTPTFMIGSSSFLQVTKTDGFEIPKDRTAELGSGKIPIYLLWEKCCDHSCTFIFDLIFNIAGSKDKHKILDEFEFQAEPISDCGGNCP